MIRAVDEVFFTVLVAARVVDVVSFEAVGDVAILYQDINTHSLNPNKTIT